MTRPLSVTIIGWLLIVLSAISLLMLPVNWNNDLARQMLTSSPLSYEVHMLIGALFAAIGLACGIGVLKGRNWARILYAAAGVLGLLIGLLTSPMKSMMLFNVLFLAVILFFLFRRPADAFFGKSYFGTTGDAPGA